eukprot:TRINITY_DN22401_c0_g2_i2.p1 TRINITY_DN22401_c0_g2~~TRINITY_DN22401_c0_g2_i2.p1  ORF type:complete len:130 (+),score=3.87 TRINITY_DN22401_c0_g2_i2:305-694(+)
MDRRELVNTCQQETIPCKSGNQVLRVPAGCPGCHRLGQATATTAYKLTSESTSTRLRARGVFIMLHECDLVATMSPEFQRDFGTVGKSGESLSCLLYTSDAADEEDSVDLGGRRIIQPHKTKNTRMRCR